MNWTINDKMCVVELDSFNVLDFTELMYLVLKILFIIIIIIVELGGRL